MMRRENTRRHLLAQQQQQQQNTGDSGETGEVTRLLDAEEIPLQILPPRGRAPSVGDNTAVGDNRGKSAAGDNRGI